jgi:hypothetical protein
LPSRKRIAFIDGIVGACRAAQNRLPAATEEATMARKLCGMLVLAAALVSCGKPQEAASEKVAAKVIESAISKDGTTAKVDLSGGALAVKTTDASGKTSQIEMGAGTKVTEAELGVPLYPGLRQSEGGVMRISTPEGTAITVTLQSDDPVDKVAAFYRDQLKGRAEGKHFMDSSSGDGATLALSDDKSKETIQVYVVKAENGSDVQISAQRAPTTK